MTQHWVFYIPLQEENIYFTTHPTDLYLFRPFIQPRRPRTITLNLLHHREKPLDSSHVVEGLSEKRGFKGQKNTKAAFISPITGPLHYVQFTILRNLTPFDTFLQSWTPRRVPRRVETHALLCNTLNNLGPKTVKISALKG